MINYQKVLAIIPARGGSKGVPRKNIRDLAGKPLIAWTIEKAKKSKYIDRLVLSSEDAEIIKVAKTWGCDVPFVRPIELAQDETPGIEPVLHALTAIPNFDYVVLLQPTSPLRSVLDIDGCIKHCIKKGANACVSVTEAEKNPNWMYRLDADSYMKPVIRKKGLALRRQDLPTVYALNGAVYVAKCEWLKTNRVFLCDETVAFIMPQDRSIDIDSEFDLRICNSIMSMTDK